MLMPDLMAQGSPAEEGTFVEAIDGYPPSLDPAVPIYPYPQEVVQNVYETLVWYNGPSATVLRPMLAVQVPSVENGGISVDGRTYVYELRDDVRFHNGDQLTAADVVYSIERSVGHQRSFWKSREHRPVAHPRL